MSLQSITLDQLTEQHLAELIQTAAPETLYIEYKSQTYGESDGDRDEFLRDVSSFANSAGGDIIIGMSAEKGVAKAITGFHGDIDGEKLRLEQIARAGLEPRIPNLRVHTVKIASGGNVIVIRVPRSYVGPHRVTFKGKNRFWARSSGGKYEPNVQELRGLFIEAPHFAERIREFRFDRVARIVAGETPVALAEKCVLVVHVIPFSAFDLRQALDIATVNSNGNLFPPPGRTTPRHTSVNFDGFLGLSNRDADADQHAAYVQVFRNGIVEGVSTVTAVLEDGRPWIPAARIESYIIGCCHRWSNALGACGVAPPFAVLVSLVGGKGYIIKSGLSQMWDDHARIIPLDQLHFSEAIIQTPGQSPQEWGRLIRPLLDQLWNAVDYPEAPTFNEDGSWALLL